VRNRIIAAGFALLLVAGIALAETFREGYAEIGKPSYADSDVRAAPTFVAALSGLDGTDSFSWNPTTALANRLRPTHGDPTLEVTVRHSESGSTACIAVGHRDRHGNFHGIAGVQTSTASGGNAGGDDGTGFYGGEKLYFPLLGWAKYEIRVYDVSGSGTVDLKPVTVGAAGTAAE
jgi:hypothetical protein